MGHIIAELYNKLKQAAELDGMGALLENAINYMIASNDGKGNEVGQKWLDNASGLNLFKSCFRSVEGHDHTMLVLDIDTYPSEELLLYNTLEEAREIRLKAALKVVEEIRKADPNFLIYLSGTGAYMVRKVYPHVSKTYFAPKIKELVKKMNGGALCECDNEHCTKWHRRNRKYSKWVKTDSYWVEVAIDVHMFEKKGRHVFRIPYSVYPKIPGKLFVTSPVVFNDDGTINIPASIKNTHPSFLQIRDFHLPVEELDEDKLKESALQTTIKRGGVGGGVVTGEVTYSRPVSSFVQQVSREAIYLPSPEDPLTPEQERKIEEMHQLLTGPPEKTPPCVKNAYLKSMPNRHMCRVIIGRYLLHKGYSVSDIGLFIQRKINDEEDNLPRNRNNMIANLRLYIMPTESNPRYPPSCAKMQDPSSDFYACTPEDAKVCKRSYVLNDYGSRRWSIVKKDGSLREDYVSSGLLKQLIEKEPKGEVINIEPLERGGVELDEEEREAIRQELKRRSVAAGSYPVFKSIIKKAEDIMSDDLLTVVKKTTRAGLTTSLVIAAKKKGKRLLVLVPTNKIALETFPEAIAIGEQVYGEKIKGAVLANNPKGCLKLAIKIAKARKKLAEDKNWGERYVALERLPVILKPQCISLEGKKCKYYDSVFEEGRTVTVSEITNLEMEEGKCARITVLRNIDEYDVVFATYAKIVATLNSNSDEALMFLSGLEEFDAIMLDEVTYLMSTGAKQTRVARIVNGKPKLTTDWIKQKIATMLYLDTKTVPIAEIVDKLLSLFEENALKLIQNVQSKEKRTFIVDNPFTPEESEWAIKHYFLIQNIVEKHNVDLSIVASLLLMTSAEKFYMTAVDDGRGKTEISVITKPEADFIKQFIKKMVRMGKKVVVTDATLPPLHIKRLIGVENTDIKVKTVDIGDPRLTNQRMLLVPDSKYIPITWLEKKGVYFERLKEMIEHVLLFHDAEDVMVVMPNSKSTFTEIRQWLSERHPKVFVTYYRSPHTVGVANKRRVMIAVCEPLPPSDSQDWLASYLTVNSGTDITEFSKTLRHFSASHAFYQTIGRVKDPAAVERSVVYLFGINRARLRKLLSTFHPPKIAPYVTSDKFINVLVGVTWYVFGYIPTRKFVSSLRSALKNGTYSLPSFEKKFSEEELDVIRSMLEVVGILAA